MSTTKSRRTRPAASAACDIIAPPSGWAHRYTSWFGRAHAADDAASPEKSLSSFEIDDATFLECLVNDVGSPDDTQQRHFLAKTPPRLDGVVVAATTAARPSSPSPVLRKAKKKVTFASNGAASKAKAKSMPDLLEPPDLSAAETQSAQPRPEPKATSSSKNPFVFASFMQFSTKRTSSFTNTGPPVVDQR